MSRVSLIVFYDKLVLSVEGLLEERVEPDDEGDDTRGQYYCAGCAGDQPCQDRDSPSLSTVDLQLCTNTGNICWLFNPALFTLLPTVRVTPTFYNR